MIEYERNKLFQSVLCNDSRIKQKKTTRSKKRNFSAKSFFFNIQDYNKTKLTETLIMTLTPQLRKREHHIHHQSKTNIDFRKLVRN